MSTTTATLLAGSFAALLGVVVERLLRLAGLLRFEASEEPKLRLTGAPDNAGGYESPVSWKDTDETTEALGVVYRFAFDLFNGKEVPTGLRDLAVVLVHEGGRSVDRPQDVRPESVGYPAVFNIPPRQFLHIEVRGEFGKEEANAIKTGRWERLVFEAKRPKRPFLGILGSKTYRKTIIKP